MLTPILVLVLFAPILYLPGSGGFEAPKVALLLIVSAALMWVLIRKNKLVIRRPISSILIVAIISYLIIRNGWVTAPGYAWLGTENSHFGVIAWIAWLVVLFVSINWQPNKQQRLQLLATVGISLLGMLLVIAIQKTGFEGINWYSYDDPERGRNLIGSIGGSGHLGIFLLLIGLGTIPIVWKIKKLSLKYTAITILAITAIVIVLTKSISALTGLILAIALGLMYWRKISLKTLYLTLIFVFLLLPFGLSTNIGSNLAVKIAPSLADRTHVWQSANKGLTNPNILLFGAGIEQFQTVYDQNYPPQREGARALTEEHVHSLVYEILTEWGLVGLMLVVSLCYSLIKEGLIIEYWYVIPLLVWLLIAQANIITLTFWPILLTYILLGSRGNSKQIIKLKEIKWRNYFATTISISWILITALVANSLVAFAINQDAGSSSSAKFEFSKAASFYEKIVYQPVSNPFAKLQLAEALTNEALLNNDVSSNAQKVITNIKSVNKKAPTARNSAISLKILSRWAETNEEAYNLYRSIGVHFLQAWPNNPQYKNIVQSLRGRVN